MKQERQRRRRLRERLRAGVSLMLAAVMVLAMCLTAWADVTDTPTTYTLTINSKTSGHTYEAYQVFSGTYGQLNGADVLSDIQWGSGISDAEALLAALKADDDIGSRFTNCTTAEQVAAALKDIDNQGASTNIDLFADIVADYLTTTYEHSGAPSKENDIYKYTISGLAGGYYLVKDKDGSLTGADNAYTKFMLQVLKSEEVNAKADVPTIDKVIQTTTGISDTDSATVGDDVTYVLSSKVPTMDGYNRYYYIVKDTLSKGLTFKQYDVNSNIEVKVGNTVLTEVDNANEVGDDTAAYKFTTYPDSTTGETKLTITFINFRTLTAGQDITITYKAKLNENAVIGEDGNENAVKLQYSNNPNYDYKGNEPEDDGKNPPTGETTEKTVYHYSTKLIVAKVDGDGNKLTGAKFKLTGNGIHTTVTVDDKTTTTYVKDANGLWYIGDNDEMQEAGSKEEIPAGKDRYEQVTVRDKVVTTDTTVEGNGLEAEVDPNGYLVFTGLGAGEYKLEEVTAPAGYNKIADITINITFTPPTNVLTNPKGSWSGTYTVGANGSAENCVLEDDGIKVTVENKKGGLLPTTGGVGTMIFTIGGIVLMGGAVVIMMVKKRREQ